MARRHITPRLPGILRHRISGWHVLALLAAQVPVTAFAQAKAPELPKVEAPKLPEAPKVDAPKVPEAPKVDAKAPKTPKVDAPKADTPKGDAAKEPAAPAGDAAAPEAATVPEDADIVLLDSKPKTGEKGVPATLPRELRSHVQGSAIEVQDSKNKELTIEEIINSPIVSATNRKESALDAPAWAIVITAKDLRDRGYTDMSQVLDDLPGMDVIRPYGDFYVRNYWRGYRSTSADPYLVLVDGVVMNHLLYKDGQVLATVPLSHVDHIEVIYGPASATYGSNAATGIINVITTDGQKHMEAGEYGVSFNTRLTFGGPQANFAQFDGTSKIVDASAFYIARDYRVRLTARLESSALDNSIADDFEYTKSSYSSSSTLWGSDFLKGHPDLGGTFLSVDRKAGVDARLFIGKTTEIAAQFYMLSTGYGTVYPSDRMQNSGIWTNRELNVYARYNDNLSPIVASSSLVQFRQSNVVSPSYYVSRTVDATAGTSEVALEHVESPNLGVVVTQDFDITLAQSLLLNGDRLSFGTGLRYEHVEINHGNKGYNILSHVVFPSDGTPPTESTDVDTSVGLAPTPDDLLGAYVLGKYAFLGRNSVNAGLRMDKGSRNGNIDFTFRGGYVGTFFDMLTAKLLYGQAVFRPGPYEIERSTSTLSDQRSQTAEGHVSFLLPWLAVSADGYYVHYTNPIVAPTAFTFANLDKREIVGMDLGARLFFHPFKVPLQIWGYYSRIFLADDTDTAGTTTSVGDLALDKGWIGATFDKWPVTVTLLSRWVAARDPVSTNPTGTLPWYAVLDGNVMLSDIPVKGLWFALRVSNIIGSTYSHPGLQTAGSGDTPGTLSGTTWTGSLDDFNSRLPQPGRGFYGSIGLTFEPAKSVGNTGK